MENILVADSPRVGAGNFSTALQIYHDNGSFDAPTIREIQRRASLAPQTEDTELSVTAMGYHGTFQSKPLYSSASGRRRGAQPFRLIDPFGRRQYRPIGTHWPANGSTPTAAGITQVNAFEFQQYLNLLFRFTYYLDDATDYYNVTRNPMTCVAGYTTCDPGPHTSHSYSPIVRPTTCGARRVHRSTRLRRAPSPWLAATSANNSTIVLFQA